MKRPVTPLDLTRVQVHPLAERESMSRIRDILVSPDATTQPCPEPLATRVEQAVADLRRARERQASVICFYGAHLVKNGASLLVRHLVDNGWITHLATNGAGVIHDWEFAFQEWSTESVRNNVATGTFGTWEETGRYIHLALLTGGVRPEGFGASVGRLIEEERLELPDPASLRSALQEDPASTRAPARAELLVAMERHDLDAGSHPVPHPWKSTSILAGAFAAGIPLTVHPGIGYDIISNHPMFNGAAIGRAAEYDFRLMGGSIEGLDDGVVLSIGSAIMAPQVFEKSLSCVNNLRRQQDRPVVHGHAIHVVDLQDGGNWDWTQGEPPRDNPAYYLRFCKSFSRMGGSMHYLQMDNVQFLHQLVHRLT